MDAVASMLYLDYGKNDGEWVANIYGGNQNLEAMEFLKHVNSMIHRRGKGALSIACLLYTSIFCAALGTASDHKEPRAA